jgi:hypothetical protein
MRQPTVGGDGQVCTYIELKLVSLSIRLASFM